MASSTFEPLVDCQTNDPASAAPVKVPVHPWSAAIDNPPVARVTADQILTGDQVINTEAYRAANLPAYNAPSSLLSDFLL